MILFAMPLIILLFSTLYIFVLSKYCKTGKVLKGLGILLFFAYAGTLFYNYKIDSTVALVGVLSPSTTVLILLLRWVTTIVTAIGILSPFYSCKSYHNILKYILAPIVILNIIFYNQNLVAIFGKDVNYFLQYRTYFWLTQVAILGFISVVHIHSMVKQKEYRNFKFEWKRMMIVFVLLMPVFFQQGTIHILFGDYGGLTKEFSSIHRITLYFSFALMIGIYILMRNKSKEEKDLLFATLSFSALTQFFYLNRPGLAALPLHLCNTAVILMFFGFIFKLRGIFYFTYFVNVLGALAAMLLPNISFDAFSINSVHFWYNHIYAFILPVLGVALKVYPRPNAKMIKSAIVIFTIYFVFAAVMNAWFNNYEPVDYFFIYSDFFPDKFGFLIPIKWNYILDIPIGKLTFRFYYLFQIVIYFAFIILMFLTWIVYDYLYKISDAHYALLLKKRKDKMDVLGLKKELNGRALTDPIDPQGVHMIKIENFTKVYGNSKNKSVDDFSLTVNDGEVFGFLGHNGAGKSTTIKSMVGIQSITSGKIEIDGYDVAKQPLEAKLRIGYVSDNHAVYEKLTGREYINYVADLYLVSQEDRDERISKYVKMFALEEAIDNEIKSYSHGMKQKIVVIASLIHEPKVWILDEPLTGLDPTSSYQIKECMREHANRGNIVFFSSHVIEVVEKICDKICIISKGKMQGVYSLAELKKEGITLEKLYLQHVASMK